MDQNFRAGFWVLLPFVGILVYAHIATAVMENGVDSDICSVGNMSLFCIPLALLVAALAAAALPGAIVLLIAEFFYSHALGINLSFWNFTFLIICANVFCLVGAYSDRFHDLMTTLGSYGVTSEPTSSFKSETQPDSKTVKEETERQSARAEMEDAISEHESAKARLDELRRRE
jgi:hypothetical protein